MPERVATCGLCKEFTVPWGDHIGPALMKQHQETDCPRTAAVHRLPSRIQRQRTKGWRMPEGAVYVGRPSRWGNPFRIGGPIAYPYDVALQAEYVRDAAHAVELFRAYAHITSGYELVVRQELAGRDLVCWCPVGQPCHADVLLDLANGATDV